MNPVDQKQNVLAKSADGLLDSVSDIEKLIFAALEKWIDNLPQSGGKITVPPKDRAKAIEQMRQVIASVLNSSKWNDPALDYLRNLDVIDKLNGQIHNAFNNISLAEITAELSDIKKQAINEITSKIGGQGLASTFTQPLTEAVYRQVATGGSVSDVKNFLQQTILSTPQTAGSLRRIVGQVAHDAVYQYDGLINQVIADRFKLNGFLYVGSIIDDSRELCRKLVNMKKVSSTELSKILNSRQWDGLIPGTTSDNFMVYRGGYRCRHLAIPVRVE